MGDCPCKPGVLRITQKGVEMPSGEKGDGRIGGKLGEGQGNYGRGGGYGRFPARWTSLKTTK